MIVEENFAVAGILNVMKSSNLDEFGWLKRAKFSSFMYLGRNWMIEKSKILKFRLEYEK